MGTRPGEASFAFRPAGAVPGAHRRDAATPGRRLQRLSPRGVTITNPCCRVPADAYARFDRDRPVNLATSARTLSRARAARFDAHRSLAAARGRSVKVSP